jgi:nucleotide-binding universal stress UspA family protein
MNRILVALDGSPRAERVLKTAIALAKNDHAKLILLRVFGIPSAMPAHVWALPDGSLLGALEDDAKKYMDACGRAVPAELLDRTEVALGVPWQTICEVAKKDDVDLIVVGSHGYSGIDHVIGTTAAKVVNHADRSVLVLRPRN